MKGTETKKMGTRKIVKIGDDTLRKTCKRQEKFDLRLGTLLKDMAETMYQAEGVGLAGPQVGILRRVAVVDVTEDHSGQSGNCCAGRHADRPGRMPERSRPAGCCDTADEGYRTVSGQERKVDGTGDRRV